MNQYYHSIICIKREQHFYPALLMGNEFISNIAFQRPNNKNSLLYGTQFAVNENSYFDLCRVLADNEEPKDYVCPGREDTEVERVGIKNLLPKRIRYDQHTDKPQESYAYMIYKALESSTDNKLTLSEIYAWIEKMYPFYRTADPVWKNSIRHNLSLNSAFKKIPRPETSRGKGGFWAIDYASQKNGKALKRRRTMRTIETMPVSNIMNDQSGKLIF